MRETLSIRPRPPQAIVDAKRAARMDRLDGLPQDWRALVHEYGLSVVDALRQCGVAKAAHARHIVETVLNEMSPLRGSFSSQGERGTMENHMVLVPCEPTDRMIDASMATVSNFNVAVSKREKHRLRLVAALAAASGRRSERAVKRQQGPKVA